MTRIPIIDIAPLAGTDAAAIGRVARELCEAYEQVGFAYVQGHGITDTTIAEAFAASRAFHAATPEQKRSIAINDFHRGYMGYATSTIVTSSVAQVKKPNLSESLMLMHELAPDDPDLLARRPLQGPNQWPSWLPGFRKPVQQYIAEIDGVAKRIVTAFAIGLGLPRNYFDAMFARPTTFLRLLHYPPQPPTRADDEFGSAPHTDYGCITLLAQDNSGGLQVRSPEGTWLDARPIPGTFVLNAGDLMPRWTNGRFKSTPHRVVNLSGGDRYSIPYFYDPSMDARIELLPPFVTPDNAPEFEPVEYGDYLMTRLNKNYTYRQN
jgi:isopenicillin N synthase-like dioxygenase